MTIHTLTCGDLAALGGPWDRLHQHDPRHMDTWHDTLCLCYTDGPPFDDVVRCWELRLDPIGEDLMLRLCCLCSPEYGDVLRARHRECPADSLFQWVRDQCWQAIAYRDRRRTDSSPTIADMDLEAAAVEGGS